jgi:hypothetical protein
VTYVFETPKRKPNAQVVEADKHGVRHLVQAWVKRDEIQVVIWQGETVGDGEPLEDMSYPKFLRDQLDGVLSLALREGVK